MAQRKRQNVGFGTCLFCKSEDFNHTDDCAARYDRSKLAFPDAEPTPEGQRRAARAHRRRILEVGRVTRAAAVERHGEAHVRRIELAVRAVVKGLTPAEEKELHELNEANA